MGRDSEDVGSVGVPNPPPQGMPAYTGSWCPLPSLAAGTRTIQLSLSLAPWICVSLVRGRLFWPDRVLGPNERNREERMTQQTKAERSASAKKAAATRQKNEAKNSGNDLKNAAGNAVDAAKDIGEAAVGTAGKAAKAVSKRVGS